MKKQKKLMLLSLVFAIHSAYATIDIGSGTKTLIETDYVYKSNQEFSFSRYYNHVYKFWQFDFENSINYSNYNGIEAITILKPNFQNTVFKKINNEWVNSGQDSKIKILIDSQNNITIIKTNGDKEIYKSSNGQLDNGTILILKRIERINGQYLNIESVSTHSKKITDSYNNEFTINYTDCNNNKIVNDFIGIGEKKIIYTYSPSCNLEKVTYQDGSIKKYEISSGSGNLVKTYDENNNLYQTTNYLNNTGSYQPGNKAISEGFGIDGNINKTTLSYNVANQVTVKDSLNNAVIVKTTKNNGLFKITGYDSICTSCNGIQGSEITYDSEGFIDTVKDFKNNISKYTWYSNGALKTLTEAYGTSLQRETAYVYDNSGVFLLNKTEQVPGGNKVTTYTYNNSLITKITVTAPSGNSDLSNITKEYNMIYSGDKLIEVRNPLYSLDNTQKTLFSYQTRGQIHTITNELGQLTTYDLYDDYGNPRQVTMPNGNVYLFTYDLRGRVLTSNFKSSLLSNDDEITQYSYDLVGQLIKLITPSGDFSTFKYDTANRLTSIEDWSKDTINPDGIFQGKVDFILDDMSNINSMKIYNSSNTLIRNTTQTYDNKNRLFKTIGSLNQTTTYTYDNNSNLSKTIDSGNFNFIQNSDALNRIISMTNPDNSNILLNYNQDDSISNIIDAKALSTAYKYDGFNNLIEINSPDTGTTKYTYDLNNNLKSKTDSKGEIKTYSYDEIGRIKKINFSSNLLANVSTIYDTCMVGKLCSIQNGNGIHEYTYNSKGRLLKSILNYNITNSPHHSLFNKQMIYEYDNFGKVISITYPSGNKIGYEYSNDKIITVNYNNSNIVSDIQYEAFESLEKSFKWNTTNQDTHSKNINLDGVITQINNSQSNSYRKNYGYDSRFNITSINGINNNFVNSQSANISYDNKSRVTGLGYTDINNSNSTTESNEYAYNTSDDRLNQINSQGSTSYEYENNSHRLTGLNGSNSDTLSYDLNGNLISKNGYQFSYNSDNRLSSTSSLQHGITTYSYNSYGQRIRKQTINGSEVKTQWFIYSGSKLMYEEIQINNEAIIKNEYLYLNDKIIGFIHNNTIYYVQSDHLGTPRNIVNSITGNVVWEWINSEPFGNSQPIENGISFNLRFPGQYYDEEKENSYNINRDYSHVFGRYIQSDPIGLDGGINTYNYVNSNPLIYIDPEGLFSMMDMTTVASLRRNTTLDEAVMAGVMTRTITMPAIAIGLSPSAIGLIGSATMGSTGLVGDLCFNPNQIISVSRWGASRPNGLQKGDWVMKGKASPLNYIKSGKLQKGFGNEYAPYSSGQNFLVKRADLHFPKEYGLGFIKGSLGQRRYYP